MKKNTLTKAKNTEEKSLSKIIFKTMLKTLALSLFALGFIVISISVVAPSIVAPTYDALGLDNATYLIYKRMYFREPTKENLYNVIQLAIEEEEYEDQALFIKLMLEDEEFGEFAEVVDEKTKEVLGKKYSVYADSYESYLRRHIVVSLYKTGKEMEAKMMAIDSVYDTVDELYVYVSLVVNDVNLIEIQKESELKTLYTRYGIIDLAGKEDPLQMKIKEIDEKLSLSDSNYDSVIYLDQKIKLEEIRYYLAKYAKNTTMEEEAKANIDAWITMRDNIKKKLV